MRKKTLRLIDQAGSDEVISSKDFSGLREVMAISRKRTRHIAHDVSLGAGTIPDALSRAYLQGMNDVAIAEKNRDEP